MPQTVCIHCGSVGFVRHERVIVGTASKVVYYCHKCDKSWSDDPQETSEPAADVSAKP